MPPSACLSHAHVIGEPSGDLERLRPTRVPDAFKGPDSRPSTTSRYMPYSDAVSRISQIYSELQALQSAFNASTATTTTTSQGTATTGTGSTSFATQLAQAQASGSATPVGSTPASGASATGGAAVTGGSTAMSPTAARLLTSDQQAFGARLAADTGLNPQVIAAWMLAEESDGAAKSRQAASNNDWLNIGYTDSGTYGSSDSIWSNPITAADATAGWIKGQDTIPGYGRAAAGIRAIQNTVGQPASAQISALQNSGWAGSGYGSLPQLLQMVGGG